jgi:hypothetical protein
MLCCLSTSRDHEGDHTVPIATSLRELWIRRDSWQGEEEFMIRWSEGVALSLCAALVLSGCTVSSQPIAAVPPEPVATGPYEPVAAGPYGPMAAPPYERSAPAQPFIYPDKGQSPEQQEFDRGQCYSWAVQQSGFDPANPQVATGPPPMAGPPPGGVFPGAARGAALGAVGGAIGGNAAKGAAIGAATGAVFGGMRRRRWAEEEQWQQTSYAAQQQGALNQGRASYNRAFGACMAGRGYTVR